MTNSKSVDRRTLRTRRALRDALLSLLVEKGWDDLSVQDLCDRADIGRSTFYLHFPSKEELLKGSLDDLRGALNALTDEVGKTKPVRPLAFVHGLLDHIHEQRQLCRSIFGRRSAHTVQVRFREMVTTTLPRWHLRDGRGMPPFTTLPEHSSRCFLGGSTVVRCVQSTKLSSYI